MKHVGEVVEYVEGQVDVDLVQGLGVLTKLPDLLLLRGGFLGFCECLGQIFLDFAPSTFFQKPVDFLFHFFEVLLFGFLLDLFWFLDLSLLALVWDWLALESGRSVGLHGSSEPLLSGSSHGRVHGPGSHSILVRRWWWSLL